MARDLVTITVEAQGVVSSQGFDSLPDAIDFFGDNGFTLINAAYDPTQPASGVGDFRGFTLIAEYPTTGPELLFTVPGVPACTRQFNGATREASRDALESFLENNLDGCLTSILQGMVANTGIDPVSGNPNSLMALMAAADFGMGTSLGSEPRSRARTSGEAVAAPRMPSVQGRFGRYEVDGFNQNVVQLPLGYKIPLADPRWAVLIDVPLTFIDTEGGQSYSGSAGVGLRMPVLDNWSLTPIARIGGVGSDDLAAFSGVYSLSLVSDLVFDLGKLEPGGLELVIGNSVTFLKSFSVGGGNADFDYELTNTVFRNGVGVQGPLNGTTLFGEPLTWELAAINTQFTGDDTYVSNYTEVHATVGTRTEDRTMVWDSFRLGLSYTFGDQGYDGLRLSFGYQW
jgi:hypothetical protein